MSDDPFEFTPVVYPSALTSFPTHEMLIDDRGCPRDVSFGPTRCPASVVVEYSRSAEPAYGADSRATGVLNVRVSPGYAKAGWKLRRDYFREWHAEVKSKEDKAKVVECWNHWQDFYSRCHDNRRPSVAGKTFPDKYLPPAEVALRKSWAENQTRKEWDPERLSVQA